MENNISICEIYIFFWGGGGGGNIFATVCDSNFLRACAQSVAEIKWMKTYLGLYHL